MPSPSMLRHWSRCHDQKEDVFRFFFCHIACCGSRLYCARSSQQQQSSSTVSSFLLFVIICPFFGRMVSTCCRRRQHRKSLSEDCQRIRHDFHCHLLSASSVSETVPPIGEMKPEDCVMKLAVSNNNLIPPRRKCERGLTHLQACIPTHKEPEKKPHIPY